MVFLALGFITNNVTFSWIAIAFILIFLVAGGRWLRKRRK
jgi:hypothetical protein